VLEVRAHEVEGPRLAGGDVYRRTSEQAATLAQQRRRRGDVVAEFAANPGRG
jgi:hypothetical protein